MKDLFEHYQEQPPQLKNICDKWMQKLDDEGLNYNDCATFQNEVEAIGYTFDYELSAEPFNLRKIDKYAPNGTPEDINLGILHSINGYYVSNEGTKQKPNFHVWIPQITHAVCDSAYNEISLAVARCNYLESVKTTKSRLIHFKN